MSHRTNRREFLQTSALATAGFWVASRPAWAQSNSPNEKLNIAKVGCANQGGSDLNDVSSENIVALCDVDEALAADAFKRFEKAAKFNDYREMLDKMHKRIDAVVVSTPDHMHAPISLAAMQLGKHVYCQKPLVHTVGEARRMAEAAAKYKVITQMGNQGHSSSGARETVEMLRSGVIGPVREVYCWTDRPIGWWPQGVDRPADTPPVPPTLHWDLWLGVAPERPYHPAYLPSKWRGWWDFGTGSMGDMACHICDVAYWALELRNPTAIYCETSELHKETAPLWAKITWEFPARGPLPPLKLHWWDGKKRPPAELFEGQKIEDNGTIFIGDKGKIYCPDAYCGQHKLLPEKNFEGYTLPAATLPRVPDQRHHQAWIRACKEGQAPKDLLSDFVYAGGMTETLLLGNLSVRVGKRIEWDAKARKVTNEPEANQYVDPAYRKGWA